MTTNKNSINVRDIAFIAVFAALIIVLAFVSIPVGTAGIPIVLQNAAIILTGLVLGGKRGFLAAALFLALGLIGLPVLAGGRSTLSAISGPSIGYLVGYLVSPLVAGSIAYTAAKTSKGARVLIFAIAAYVGLACQYICGAIGLMLRAAMDVPAAAAAQVPFLLPDAIKVLIAVLIALAVHAAFPDLLRRRSN